MGRGVPVGEKHGIQRAETAVPGARGVSARPRRARFVRRQRLLGYGLVIPAMVVLGAVVGVPTADAFILSLTNSSLIGTGSRFVGLANFTALLTSGEFWSITKTTVIWTAANTGAQLLIGTGMALLLNSSSRVDKVLRSIALLPWAVPSIVAAAVWRFMYDPTSGVIDHLLLSAHLIHQPVVWLGEISTALPAVILESVWKGSPFVMIIVLAGLQTIPPEIEEAALIDGAGLFPRLIRIKLPFIRTTLALATILTVAYTVNNFNAIWLMTQGGPLQSTQILFTWGYQVGFQQFYLGQAAAISVVLFGALMIIAVVYFLTLERKGSES